MHLLNCNIILAEHLFPDKSYVNNIYKRRNYSSDETGHAWVCSTYARRGKAFCPHSRVIPESELLKLKNFKEIIV